LRALQLAELSVLKDIDAVCKKHNIEYFLDSGTALGAARHEGFIPWDDDVDIGMLREDYERFLPIAKEELKDTYVVACPGEIPGYAPMFAKVWKKGTKFYTDETIDAGLDQGVFVDIFVYTQLNADPGIAKQQVKECTRWQRISYLYHSKAINVPHSGILGALESFACVLAHGVVRLLFSEERIVTSFQRAEEKGAQNPGEGCVCLSYPVDPPFKPSMFLPAVPLRFEDTEFPCPRELETYLVKTYGDDWTELPPEDQRRNHAPVELDLGTDN
ncbi:MAG: LicD family protein, partial [Raoultibacter sp.]